MSVIEDIAVLTALFHVNNNDYFDKCDEIANLLPKKYHESLKQLVDGPCHDGDVISPTLRDDLIAMGLATRICYRGEQGFNASTLIGYTILKNINQRKITMTPEQIISLIKADPFTVTAKTLVIVCDKEDGKQVASIDVSEQYIEFENCYMKFGSKCPSFAKLLESGFTSNLPWGN